MAPSPPTLIGCARHRVRSVDEVGTSIGDGGGELRGLRRRRVVPRRARGRAARTARADRRHRRPLSAAARGGHRRDGAGVGPPAPCRRTRDPASPGADHRRDRHRGRRRADGCHGVARSRVARRRRRRTRCGTTDPLPPGRPGDRPPRRCGAGADSANAWSSRAASPGLPRSAGPSPSASAGSLAWRSRSGSPPSPACCCCAQRSVVARHVSRAPRISPTRPNEPPPLSPPWLLGGVRGWCCGSASSSSSASRTSLPHSCTTSAVCPPRPPPRAPPCGVSG